MINLVKDSGFCFGVRAAVHNARALVGRVASGGEKVYFYGDLVNNRAVMDGFLRDGFVIAEKTADIDEGVVIIRAHGVGRAVYDELAAKNVEIIDCTCVKVKKIHEIVTGKKNVVIIGKKNHPEVLGIFGWCSEGAIIAETEADLAEAKNPLYVVGQTTCNKAWWEKAVEIIKTKNPNAEIFNTFCDATAKKIENAVETAKVSDAMIVIGDKKSANSLELFEACKAVCGNVLFVSSLKELAENFKLPTSTGGKMRAVEIGIAGSASAPAEIINEIHEFLLFAEFLAQAKSEIETASEDYFKELITTAAKAPFTEAAIRDLHHQNQNGKRIRGTMIKLGEKIALGKNQSFLPLSLAYEIFGTAILIHDDIIDKSDTRRGKRTIHASEADPHFGVSRAVCIGDYGLFLATNILANSGIDGDVFAKVMRLFSEIQLKTLEGEIMDVSLPYFPVEILEEYDKYMLSVLKIYEYKTAWYTLAGPLMLGAILGGANEELLQKLRDIALPLGLAFQIKDDLLGIYASEKKLGKPALSDIIEKKQTILYGYAKKHATPQQLKLLEKIYGNQAADTNDLETVREIFESTGAKKFAEDEITRLSQKSLELIEELDTQSTQLLRGLVKFLTVRSH